MDEVAPKTQTSLSLPWKTRLYISAVSAITDAASRRNGTVNRRLLSFVDFRVPPTPEPIKGVKTYDVVVDPARKLWFRVFVPTEESATEELRVMIYFHGGGFVFFNPDLKLYDDVCRRFAKKLNAIVVSVDYRHAPEHKYPAQHDDCFDVLKFLDSDENRSKWLPENANISRCFLAGDSAGGNLAHHAALRACEFNFQQLKIGESRDSALDSLLSLLNEDDKHVLICVAQGVVLVLVKLLDNARSSLGIKEKMV
ncbi:probable carboxylesterase 18 [Tanacetum coccineum]